MLLKLYIIFLTILTTLSDKIQNYEFVDPGESYNFYI
jgi:hypothetical protein